jgi:hypothetical protein
MAGIDIRVRGLFDRANRDIAWVGILLHLDSSSGEDRRRF